MSERVASGSVRTVLGDVPTHELGVLDYHEHLFQVSPLLSGDELDDPARSTQEAISLRESGFDAMVDATPTALGRRAAELAAAAAHSGLHVVATSGAHRDEHYGGGHWLTEMSGAALAERFRRDVVDGMPVRDRPSVGADESAEESSVALGPDGSPVRAGLLKAGIGYWKISPFSDRVLHAIAEVHRDTGVPLMVHLEHGSAAHELLDLLLGLEVEADRVILAHIDRNPDPVLHAELAQRGAYLGYDGFARHREYPDSMVIDCLRAAAEAGAAGRILVGGDVARATRYRAYGGMPGLAYLGERVVPRLRALDAELAERVLTLNPRAALAAA